ncbi:MAG TPA: J domain-containing protein [Thermohalobaculum sp.]|nr:J domain-containing protein [Thermohalobaculum sp.]
MPHRSPLDYDVSVTADKLRRARARGMTGAFETSEQLCDWPGCRHRAKYRAPHSPDRLHAYRWFCLDHVREYNRGWNFFENHSEPELDAQARADRTWERPTWRLGEGPFAHRFGQAHAEGNAWARFGFSDPFEVLGEAATINGGEPANERPRRRLTGQEQMAMDSLGLPHQVVSRAEVRARYRALVKELHPDMNGGANPDPERLALVLSSWKVLSQSRNFRA